MNKIDTLRNLLNENQEKQNRLQNVNMLFGSDEIVSPEVGFLLKENFSTLFECHVDKDFSEEEIEQLLQILQKLQGLKWFPQIFYQEDSAFGLVLGFLGSEALPAGLKLEVVGFVKKLANIDLSLFRENVLKIHMGLSNLVEVLNVPREDVEYEALSLLKLLTSSEKENNELEIYLAFSGIFDKVLAIMEREKHLDAMLEDGLTAILNIMTSQQTVKLFLTADSNFILRLINIVKFPVYLPNQEKTQDCYLGDWPLEEYFVDLENCKPTVLSNILLLLQVFESILEFLESTEIKPLENLKDYFYENLEELTNLGINLQSLCKRFVSKEIFTPCQISLMSSVLHRLIIILYHNVRDPDFLTDISNSNLDFLEYTQHQILEKCMRLLILLFFRVNFCVELKEELFLVPINSYLSFSIDLSQSNQKIKLSSLSFLVTCCEPGNLVPTMDTLEKFRYSMNTLFLATQLFQSNEHVISQLSNALGNDNSLASIHKLSLENMVLSMKKPNKNLFFVYLNQKLVSNIFLRRSVAAVELLQKVSYNSMPFANCLIEALAEQLSDVSRRTKFENMNSINQITWMLLLVQLIFLVDSVEGVAAKLSKEHLILDVLRLCFKEGFNDDVENLGFFQICSLFVLTLLKKLCNTNTELARPFYERLVQGYSLDQLFSSLEPESFENVGLLKSSHKTRFNLVNNKVPFKISLHFDAKNSIENIAWIDRDFAKWLVNLVEPTKEEIMKFSLSIPKVDASQQALPIVAEKATVPMAKVSSTLDPLFSFQNKLLNQLECNLSNENISKGEKHAHFSQVMNFFDLVINQHEVDKNNLRAFEEALSKVCALGYKLCHSFSTFEIETLRACYGQMFYCFCMEELDKQGTRTLASREHLLRVLSEQQVQDIENYIISPGSDDDLS
eukprot:snap_masked-scaffold_4-processed-gene-1.28-mRNA-1 protein AED:1.00 eAED:1.00 QI:0/0/0/0/1/1/3/0/902